MIQPTKTVYSMIYPETAATIDDLWEEKPHNMYYDAWTKKQDDMHKAFLAAWRDWVSDVITIPERLRHSYPTNGSSEAIREAINKHAQTDNDIHTFHGEYEGYKAYAEPRGITVHEHNRAGDYRDTIDEYAAAGDKFFISQPSSIDGNVWDSFDDFLDWMHAEHPDVDIMLDVCYLGCTTRIDYTIPMKPNVHTVFFSLSKVFGVYYHRIGGAFTTEEMPNLYGNKWFKNLFSLKLGERLLDDNDLGELPRRYEHLQREAATELNADQSDVVLLVTDTGDPTKYTRTTRDDHSLNRYCVTPHIQTSLNEETDAVIKR